MNAVARAHSTFQMLTLSKKNIYVLISICVQSIYANERPQYSPVHSGKAYEGTCRIPRQNGDGRGIASARFVWIVKAIESAARPHVVCGY